MRFRCIACKKLLGVSQAKVGQSIACPVCGTKQVVPPPRVEEAEETDTASSGIWTAEGQSVTATTTEFPSLLVEHLSRDEEDDAGPEAETSPARPAESAFPMIQVDPLAIRPEGPPASAPLPPAPALTKPRARDVVMPRTVMIAWSLFVLLALALAFLSGLLTGHFLWRPSETFGTPRQDRPRRLGTPGRILCYQVNLHAWNHPSVENL